MNLRISIQGAADVQALLARFEPPEVDRVLKKAVKEGAKVMKRAVKSSIKTRLHSQTGNLLGSTRYKSIRRSRGIGYVIGPMGRKARHRHLVEFGHDITFIKKKAGGKVVGRVRPHPYMEPAFAASEEPARAAIEAYIGAVLDQP